MNAVSDKVSVIIVTHNSEAVLPGCLDSLKAALGRVTCEVIIVDNNSSDRSVAVARQSFPSAVILDNNQNRGFAAACNQGAEKADGEFLLFINPDLELDADAVDCLRVEFNRHSTAGLVAGRLRFENGSFQPSCRNLPTVRNLLFSRGSFLAGFLGRVQSRERSDYTLPDFQETTVVPAVAGTMFMVRSECFRQINGFDSRFFMFMEDTDLSSRMTQSGYDNLFVPTAGAIHRWGKGSSTGRLKRKLYHHLSLWKYFWKHHNRVFSLLLLPWLLMLNFLLAAMLPDRKTARS